MSAKILQDQGSYTHYCPGCKSLHVIPVGEPYNGHLWTFNNNFEFPTFNPSVLLSNKKGTFCHYIITDGKIYFCDDSKHDLKGQTVDLPIIPGDY